MREAADRECANGHRSGIGVIGRRVGVGGPELRAGGTEDENLSARGGDDFLLPVALEVCNRGMNNGRAQSVLPQRHPAVTDHTQ